MFVRTIRRETGLIEHICEHGVGHPAYGSADWLARTSGSQHLKASRDSWLVHGCDGCCRDHEWQRRSLEKSVEISNKIIVDSRK